MKKKYLFLCLAVFNIQLIFAQVTDSYWERMYDNPSDFIEDVKTFDQYINTTYRDSIPQEKLGNIKNYHRFVHFWKSRLGKVNNTISYEPYQKAIQNLSINGGYCNSDDLANWELIGPVKSNTQFLGLVSQVLHDPNNPENYIISSDYGGLWKSQPNGIWKNVTDNLKLPGLSSNEMIRNPKNPNHIIVATWGGLPAYIYGMGIIESFDNGNTWSVMEGFPYQTAPAVVKVLYDPYQSSNDEIALYAITKKEIYLSLDTGNTWNLIEGPEEVSPHDIFIDIEVGENGIIFLSTKYKYNATDGKIFRYKNGIWENIKAMNPVIQDFQLASFSTPYQNTIFMECVSMNHSHIYKTTNSGNTWEKLPNSFYNGHRNEIEYSPASNIVYCGGVYGIRCFKNDGVYELKTIGSNSMTFHVDVRDIDFMGIDSGNKEHLLIANDGGVTLCKVNINNLSDYELTNLNGNSLPICEPLGMAVSHSTPEFIVTGLMHNYSYRLINNEWEKFSGGDGGDCEVNWHKPTSYYYMDNETMKGTNGFLYDNDDDWFVGMQYELHPTDPYKLYFGRGKNDDYAKIGLYNESSKETIMKDLPSEVGRAGAIAVDKNDVIYVADFSPNYGDKDNRFVKSFNNGDSWIDLSKKTVYDNNNNSFGTLGEVISWKTIEDIVISPDSPNKIWIAIGGVRKHYSNNNPIDGKFRVLYSDDGGNSWHDYSENLSAFPAVALEYQTGSNDRLFVGTDAGVYYRDNNMDQWECFSKGLPISIITDLDYEPCSKYLYASAYSRSIFKTPVPFELDSPTIVNSSNEIWDNPKEISSDVLIKPNAKLTIKSEAFLSENSKIIVEPGGKLVVDGGTLTNGCGRLWQGIQVWGNKNEHQFEINGVCHQGKVELKNGAIIENARIGVDLWKPDDWSSTGGILVAEDAIFRNNVKSVHALSYKNISPVDSNFEMNNLTRMKNCTFEITEDYLGVEPFFKHVDLAHVKGIKFEGCDFSLAENAPNVSEWNQAIAAYGASFSAQAFCASSNTTPCPDEAIDKCTFTGFYHAINALGDMARFTYFDIRNSIFNNNAYGVRMCQTHQTVNLFNQYNIGTKWDCGAGIHNHSSLGFVIEENDFKQFDENVPGKYFGTITLQSESINDIYKNNFFKMSYGNYADGKNYTETKKVEGLTYTCNTNAENYADFYVGKLISPSSIHMQQGDMDYAIGNTFSANGRWHFYNGGNNLIGYYYDENTPNQIPDRDKIYYVAPVNIDVSNGCPSHYGEDGNARFVLTPEELQQAENDFNNHYSDYLNVKTLYNSYVDGGNTEGEIMDIETAQSSDAWALRDQLLGHSPHLSMEVLKKAADKTEVLNETALFDILAANPDELKKDTLISYLRNKEQPLPEYMIAILQQVAEGTTYKTALQQQMAKHAHDYTESAYAIIRSHLHSESEEPAEVRYWLGKLKGIAYDREIITSYISEGNFTDAIALANMLPELYEMDNKQLEIHGRYMELLSLYQTLYEDNRNIFQLNDNEISIIKNLSTYEDISGVLARNIFEGVYEDKIFLSCPDTPEGDDDIKAHGNIDMQQFNAAKGLSINVRPNPAKNWAIFYYTLPEYENDGTLTIQDINGNTLKTFHLNNKIGQSLLHTEEMQNGTYLYTITVGGMTQSGKFIVRK